MSNGAKFLRHSGMGACEEEKGRASAFRTVAAFIRLNYGRKFIGMSNKTGKSP